MLKCSIGTRSNYYKSIFMLYSLPTEYFHNEIGFFNNFCVTITLYDKLKNITITFYNDVSWKYTYIFEI